MGLLAGASIATLALVFAPADAAPGDRPAKSKPRLSLSVNGVRLGGFTPAVADPKLAAEFARRKRARSSFRFTPATAENRERTIRVAVRARAATPAEAQRGAGPPAARTLAVSSAPQTTAITPAAYNLGASVGWKNFAVGGDVARVEGGIADGRRDTAVVDVRYSLGRVTGRVGATADRVEGTQQRLVAADRSAALDVGGSYAITRNIELNTGVQYRIQRDRLAPLADARRDSQAVYVGTAFRF